MEHSVPSTVADHQSGFADTFVKSEAYSSGVSWAAVICWRICSRRVVAYPARVGHRARFIFRLAMVERGSLGLEYQ
jgi:hypothetical protein